MGESTSPPGDLEDHVTHPGLFPQAAAALVHCQVQPQGRVMWGKHSVLCLSMQLLSLCGGFKPFLLAFMLSMSGFFFNLMSFQSAFVPCQLYTHTQVYTAAHPPTRECIQTFLGRTGNRNRRSPVQSQRHSKQKASGLLAVKPAHATELMASPCGLPCSTCSHALHSPQNGSQYRYS